MRPRLLLTINCKFAVDFFARGLHTRTAVARLPLRQLGFLVTVYCLLLWFLKTTNFDLFLLCLLEPELESCTFPATVLGRAHTSAEYCHVLSAVSTTAALRVASGYVAICRATYR